MKNFKDLMIKEEAEYDTITIRCKDREGTIKRLIEYMGQIGNEGHSFSIIVDPDSADTKKSFGWDGDGSDYIKDVK